MGVDEKHIESLTARFMGKSLREMGFPSTSGSADEDIVMLAKIVTASQIQHLLTVKAGVESKVKRF